MHNKKRSATLALALLYSIHTAFPALADEAEIQSWTAPPYWSSLSQPGSTRPEHGRTAEGRQALAASPTALPFIALPPCRLVDTRGNGAPLQGGFLPAATVRNYTLTGVCGVPANAQAISLNATAVKPTGPGFLVLYPEGGTFPPVSTLNFLGNDVIVNAAVVPLSATGGIAVALGVSGGDVLLDTNGYYAVSDVASLSGLVGDVTLAAGSNITITPAGNTLTIAATAGSGGPPTGAAGGSLAGTYPNPTLAASSVGASQIASGAVTDVKVASGIAYSKLSGAPTSLPPTGPSGGSLAGTYPNPTLAANSVGTAQIADGSVTDPKIAAGNSLVHLPGSANVFAGASAGLLTTGGSNTAFGASALAANTSGIENVAIGVSALLLNTTGNSNLALGPYAGSSLTTGSGNVDVWNTGVAGESKTIRIGTDIKQTRAFLAGVRGVTTGSADGIPVFVDSNGQLGTAGGTITATNFSGSLVGDVTGTQGATVVAKVGTSTAALVHAAELAANGATVANTPFALVKRDSAGSFVAQTITAALTGAASANVLKTGDTMTGNLTLSPGNFLLDNSTGSTGNIFKGGERFLHAVGPGNTFLGIDAGTFSAAGSKNTGIGTFALTVLTSGANNTAVGWSALGANSSSSDNTAVGREALKTNTGGFQNTAVGSAALISNGAGFNNTSTGFNSLMSNTAGSENTATGVAALAANLTGIGNTAMGSLALGSNTSGDANTAMGRTALTSNTTGALSVAIGVGSLASNQTGSQNTSVGAQSLSASTSSPNTAVGFKSLYNVSSGLNNTAVGYLAGARDYTFPKYTDGTPFNSVPITTGSFNTFVGHGAGSVLNVSNCTAVGIDAYCDGDNQVRLGNAFVGSIGGKVGWTALSDARAKTEIRDLDSGLDLVLRLRPVAYRLKTGDGRTDMGFLAQDVEALLGDRYSVLGVGGDPDRTLSLRYQDFIAPLVKAVQEQQATIEKDRIEIRDLTTRLERLEALLSRLRR